MKSRSLFLSIAAGFLVSGIGALDTRAASVALPTTYDQLLIAGNTTTVGNFQFSAFGYTTTPVNSPPPSTAINVSAFTNIPGETGLSFQGAFAAAANTTVDYKITYTVTALSMAIADAYLSITGTANGGTGSVSVAETFTTLTGAPVGSVSANLVGNGFVGTTSFAPQTAILVTKDVLIMGGSAGANVSVINQGFSAVPEPTSMALLGIGMTGFLAFRRLFKRTSLA
jgi:hypothetical protein